MIVPILLLMTSLCCVKVESSYFSDFINYYKEVSEISVNQIRAEMFPKDEPTLGDEDDNENKYICSHSVNDSHGWIDTVRITEDGRRVSLVSDNNVYIYHYNQSISTFGPGPNQTITVERTLWTQDLCRDHQRMIVGGTGGFMASYENTDSGYIFKGRFE